MARKRRRIFRSLALGWLAGYFFDPQLGRRRRSVARDWTFARARRLQRRAARAGRYAFSTASGKTQALLHRYEWGKPRPDDVTLAHKVESIVFRDERVPKGRVSVNAVDGVVSLRGEVPDQSIIDLLVERTRAVHGVREVESLLHLPGQQAPMHH